MFLFFCRPPHPISAICLFVGDSQGSFLKKKKVVVLPQQVCLSEKSPPRPAPAFSFVFWLFFFLHAGNLPPGSIVACGPALPTY